MVEQDDGPSTPGRDAPQEGYPIMIADGEVVTIEVLDGETHETLRIFEWKPTS